MNKQEIIDYLKRQIEWSGNHIYSLVNRAELISMIEQLEEPKKVKIPQRAAEIIKEGLETGASKLEIISNAIAFASVISDNEFSKWFDNHEDIFIEAVVNDYEVEEEPKWIVRVGEKLLFKEFDENEFPVFVIDDKPGSIQLAENFDLEKKAHNVQKEVGGTVEKV